MRSTLRCSTLLAVFISSLLIVFGICEPAGAQSPTVLAVRPPSTQIGVGQTQQFIAVDAASSNQQLSEATAVSAGYHHACALLANGTVQCWGQNFFGQLGNGGTADLAYPAAVLGLDRVAAIATGGYHSCALISDGTVQCWGSNGHGQLGIGTQVGSSRPVAVTGITTATGIAAGGDHTCAVLADGTARCWGSNSFGELGNGATTDATRAVTVSGLSGATGITAGLYNTCALLANGTARCWGYYVGNGTWDTSTTPVAVTGINTATAIASGFEHSCALLADGTVRCWGYNTWGELGIDALPGYDLPVAVGGIAGATAISASYGHTCAVLVDGTARCWGENSQGALGDGTTTKSVHPVTVSGLNGATGITGGVYHACALITDGTVRCWGGNGSGQLGSGTVAPSPGPVTVTGRQALPIAGATAIAVGAYHTCALTSHGRLRCWGYNGQGQLGNGTNTNSDVPELVPGIVGATAVAAGGYHTCSVQADGRVQCWGQNLFGELGNGNLGNGTPDSSNRPVAVVGLNNIRSIAAGAYHSCALAADGGVQCWGGNADGQLGQGYSSTSYSTPLAVNGLTGVSAIASGWSHNCALMVDGTVRCWGYNHLGQLGDGTTTTAFVPVAVVGITNAIALAAGTLHTCALLANGAVKCWGDNAAGQLGPSAGGYSSLPITVGGIGNNTGGGGTGGTGSGGPDTGGNNGGGGVGGTTVPGVTAITAGDDHTCALLSDGTMQCWGGNGLGQLGDGTMTSSAAPKTVTNLSSVMSMSAGVYDTCALQTNGTVQCWGNNTYGQLGIGSLVPMVLTPDPTQEIVDRVSWTSSSPTVATIDSASGVAKGLSGGTTTITATYSNQSAPATLTVTAPTLQWIVITPSIIAIAPSATQQFTATGGYSDNSTQDLTTQVTWTSSNANVATVSSTGVASGAGVGTTVIGATFGGQSSRANLSVSSAVAGGTITFALSNVVLKNGATVTGTITIDPSMGAVLNSPVVFHNVTVNPGTSGMPAITFDGAGGYAPDMVGYDPGYLAMWIFSGAHQIHLSVPYPFTTATALPVHVTPLHVDSMVGSNVFYCLGTGCDGGFAQYDVVSGWLDPRTGIAHEQNKLQFENNYFVTGDYVSRAVDLHGVQADGNGFASGSITIPDDKSGPHGIPAGADIVAAFLYWHTLENTATPSADTGRFRGYMIRGLAVSSDMQNACWAATDASQPKLRVYRADVLPLLPMVNGVAQGAGTFDVSLPSTSGLPQTLGARLVVIYRVLSPDFPLRAVVIYDGGQVIDSNSTLDQTIRGFYDSETSYGNLLPPRYTVARSIFTPTGSYFDDANVPIFPPLEYHGQSLNIQESWGAPGCEVWGAAVFSTNVVNSDGDGILDAWKAGVAVPGADVRTPGYVDVADGRWVDLPGAVSGQKELFIQLDYMVGADGHSHEPAAAAVSKVQDAFAAHGVHLHVQPGNAIPEDTCTDDLSANPPRFCAFPGEPGVVVWKAGLELLKGWPLDEAGCLSNGTCEPRFQRGRKDSYHYVLFGHSVATANWGRSDGSLVDIGVAGNVGTITIAKPATCPQRVTLTGALVTPNLNGVYNVIGCPSPTTFRIQTVNVADGTYPGGVDEPLLTITSGTTGSASGYSDIGGADTVVTLGKWGADAARINVQAGTLMHELGHPLGLMHGGRYSSRGTYSQSYGANCKPNYQSVMNYLFQIDLLGPNEALDFSGQVFNPLDESALITTPGVSVLGGGNPTYSTTKWYAPYPPAGIGTAATAHCDGSPLALGDTPMYEVEGAVWPILWDNHQDVNYDASDSSWLEGYDDWSNVDLRQIGATGSNLPGSGILLAGGGGGILLAGGGGGVPYFANAGGALITGGGGILLAGGGGGILLAGGGGGILLAGGGGGILLAGGGGGILLAGGAGGMQAEMTREAADSYVRPPRGVTTASHRVAWNAPAFGEVKGFNVFRVVSGAAVFLAFVPYDASAIDYTFTDPNPVEGGTYLVTTVLVDSRQSTTVTPTPKKDQVISFSAPDNRTYGDPDVALVASASSGLPVSFTATGNCTTLGNMVHIKGAGSCTLIAFQSGNAEYIAAVDVSRTFSIAKGNQRIEWSNPADIIYGTALSAAQLNATASGSGADQTTGSLTYNPAAGTILGPGKHQALTVTAASTANYTAATATVYINVVYLSSAYSCGGDIGHSILSPIDNRSVFKQGSTVPAKFRVCNVAGKSIGTPGVVSSFRLIEKINGTATENVDQSVASTTPDTSFRWDSTAQQWIFNISTKSLSKNTTYVYEIALNDGSTIRFQFGLK